MQKLNFYQQPNQNDDNGTLNDLEGTDNEEVIFPINNQKDISKNPVDVR